jgi:hypothetical protein
MDNQQLAPVSETDLAYLAGLIDADGSISAHRNSNKKGLWFTPRLSFYNTDRDLVYWVRDVFQALGAGVHISSSRRAHGRRVLYHAMVGRFKSLPPVLEALIPYLRLKRKQAEVLLEFVNRRKNRNEPYSHYDLELIVELFELNGDRKNNAETVRGEANRLKRQSIPSSKE